jgi:hypothetical protein
MKRSTKQSPIIGYLRNGQVATDPRDALVFGYSEESLPRHGGGCSHTWAPPQYGLGNAPKWLFDAECARREALRKERASE